MRVDPLLEQKLDVSGVYWSMSINGVNLDFDHKKLIESITLDKTCRGADTLTIKVNDPDLVFLEDDIYLEDVPVSLDMNFHGSDVKSSFYGYISTLDPDFPENGCPSLEIFCLDKTHLMQRVKNTQTWDNVRSIDVVREKIRGYGFNLVYTEDYTYLREESISQSNQTDIEFLESLANKERELFVAKLVGDTFFYVRLGLLSEPTKELYYRYNALRNNVVSFNPSIDKETRQVEERYADITVKTKDDENFVANSATVALQTQGYPVQTSTVSYGSVRYDDSKIQAQKRKNQTENTKKADETERFYREVEYNTLRGEAQLMPTGDLLDLTYMTTVNFNGLGKYLSGLYFVEGVKQTYDSESGFSMSTTLIKTGFGKSLKPKEPTTEISVTNTSTNFSVGDVIRIVSDSATYAHASKGVKIPSWVRASTHKVSQVDVSGQCVLLKDIYSWVHMSDIEKV